MPNAALYDLNAVVAVATHCSFRRAATELGLSPSALSHTVAALEQRLGVRLFHRTTRSVALSAAGEQFLTRVRPALGEIFEAMRDAKALRDTPSGMLRINASEGGARQVLAPIVLEYLRRYPEMQVDLVTDGRLIDIVAEGFDAGIRSGESVPQDMIAVPCAPPQRFAVIGAPRYFKKHGVPKVPNDLLAHACIRYRFASGKLFKWEFAKRDQEIALDVQGPLTLDSPALMVEAALKGLGLAYVNDFMARAEIAAGKLVRVLEDWTPPFSPISLYYPGHRHVPASLRAFVAVVRDVVARNHVATP
jgi:DNA-binding transcriptional LysR family regulator